MRKVIAVALALVAFGCGEEEPAAPAAPAAPPAAPAPEQPASAREVGPVAETSSYRLEIAAGDAVAAGASGTATITMSGRGGWHLNQEYPTAVEFTWPDGLESETTRIAKADAAEFGDETARFEAPFTASAAGEHTVNALVRFAMCIESSCTFHAESLAIPVSVR